MKLQKMYSGREKKQTNCHLNENQSFDSWRTPYLSFPVKLQCGSSS